MASSPEYIARGREGDEAREAARGRRHSSIYRYRARGGMEEGLARARRCQ